MVTSTTLLMGRWPAASSRSRTQSGDGPTRTPSTTRATYWKQPSRSSISTRRSGAAAPGARGGRGRQPDLAAEERAQLPRHAEERGAVAAVRRDGEVEHGVAGGDHIGERCAHGRGGVQHQDARVLVAEAQLPGAADHAVRDHAADLAALERPAVRQLGAGEGDRDLLARRHVRRAADDLERVALPDVHAAQREPIGVGMGIARHHEAHAQLGEVGPDPLHGVDLESAGREALGDLLGRRRQIDPLGEPAERHAHQICSRKRTSGS